MTRKRKQLTNRKRLSKRKRLSNANPPQNGKKRTDGRNPDGTFTRELAIKWGKRSGGKFASMASKVRRQLEDAATEGVRAEIIQTLFRYAKQGEPWAVQEFFNRLMGKPKPMSDADHMREELANRRLSMQERALDKLDSMSTIESPELNADLIHDFVGYIKIGMPADAACDATGISNRLFHEWAKEGKEYLERGGPPEENQDYAVRCAHFVTSMNKAFAAYRLTKQMDIDSIERDALAVMKARDPANYDPQEDRLDGDNYDPDESFL